MKKPIYIFTLLMFLVSNSLFAKDKLITIYDKDCGFSQQLLNDTYLNEVVQKELSSYEHSIFEANTKEGVNYIKEFNISAYPTQIIISDHSTTLIEGYYNKENEILLLNNPKKFKDHQLNTLPINQDPFLPQMIINYLCSTMNNANASTEDPFEAFMSNLKSITTKMKLNIDNYYQYTFENIDKISCLNKDTTKMRKKSTLLKYAIDSKNYKFIRAAIFIKDNDGKNICNPYLDFNRVEVINGEEETLIQFIDKILAIDDMSDFYDFNSLRNIKMRLEGCTNSQNLYETHELKNLTESELKQIRLEQSYFYKNNKYSDIGYYSRKDKIKKYGLIDRSGSLIIPMEYERINFRAKGNGLIAVAKNGKWGFINLKNEIIIPLKYENSYPEFENGKARVEENGKEFYIDKTGKCVENCE